jgi:hypothetical protein
MRPRIVPDGQQVREAIPRVSVSANCGSVTSMLITARYA